MISNFLLIKLASNCNFDCTYCYWFRDSDVRALPATMPSAVADKVVERVREHIAANGFGEFVCSFHGGEPLLFGKRRLLDLIRRLNAVGRDTHCKMRYALTTNGSLLDDDWVTLLRDQQVSVTVSIDGPPEVHDRRRVTIKGNPTWRESAEGYLLLCKGGIAPSIIAVCDPTAPADSILDHLFGDLGATFCDVLIPDENHESDPPSIERFYRDLFDHWYDNYADEGKEVRILAEMVRGLLGLETRTDSIGLAPLQTVCVAPNGALEPHDVLRIAGSERSRTKVNVFSNSLADLGRDENWLAVRDASLSLSDECEKCEFRSACGGGHLAQRWSEEKGYDNPSVYCADLKGILTHISSRINTDIKSCASDTQNLSRAGADA